MSRTSNPIPDRLVSAARALTGGLTLSVAVACTTAASTVLPLDLSGLTELADCVVEANVISVSSGWNDARTAIQTDVELEVLRSEGSCAPNGATTRSVRLLGGIVDDIVMNVDGAPTLTEGERVVLFLQEDPSLFVPIVALDRGKFTVTQNSAGALRIENDLVGEFDRDTFWDTVTRIQEGR